MIDKLNLDQQQRREVLSLAAEVRDQIPADIAKLIKEHPLESDKTRSALSELFIAQE